MNGTRLSAALGLLLALASVALVGCGSGQRGTQAVASSPEDLGKIAYELDGSIYVKTLPDGQATRIAAGTMPRWSPSGEWLLVYANGIQWVMRGDGSSARPLPAVEGAVWSPVEDRVAYVDPASVTVEWADGSGRREIAPGTANVAHRPWALAWSPDGKRLACDQEEQISLSGYRRDGSGGKMSPINRRASLWSVDAGGESAPFELYSTTTDGVVTAGWTADSQYVLFWLDPGFGVSAMNDGVPMYSIPASGGEPRSLTFTLHSGVWEASPQGGTTIMITEGQGRMTWTGERIALANASSGRVTYLTSDATASQQPDWARDGERIVFVSQPDPGMGTLWTVQGMDEMAKDRRIWVMNGDGSGQRPLTDHPAYRDERPLWSGDGSQVLFARLDSQMRASLWLVPSGGGAASRVVDRIESSDEPLTGYYTNIGWTGMFDWWQKSP